MPVGCFPKQTEKGKLIIKVWKVIPDRRCSSEDSPFRVKREGRQHRG